MRTGVDITMSVAKRYKAVRRGPTAENSSKSSGFLSAANACRAWALMNTRTKSSLPASGTLSATQMKKIGERASQRKMRLASRTGHRSEYNHCQQARRPLAVTRATHFTPRTRGRPDDSAPIGIVQVVGRKVNRI
eukprot:scaffold272610_cov32-Tisochrysis_lutea.AAC.2